LITDPNISLNATFSNALHLYESFKTRDQVSHTYETADNY